MHSLDCFPTYKSPTSLNSLICFLIISISTPKILPNCSIVIILLFDNSRTFQAKSERLKSIILIEFDYNILYI